MSKFIKKAGKETAGITSSAFKKAITAMLGNVIKEIMEDSKFAEVAQDKLMSIGLSSVKELGMNPKNFQHDLVKKAMLRELKK